VQGDTVTNKGPGVKPISKISNKNQDSERKSGKIEGTVETLEKGWKRVEKATKPQLDCRGLFLYWVPYLQDGRILIRKRFTPWEVIPLPFKHPDITEQEAEGGASAIQEMEYGWLIGLGAAENASLSFFDKYKCGNRREKLLPLDVESIFKTGNGYLIFGTADNMGSESAIIYEYKESSRQLRRLAAILASTLGVTQESMYSYYMVMMAPEYTTEKYDYDYRIARYTYPDKLDIIYKFNRVGKQESTGTPQSYEFGQYVTSIAVDKSGELYLGGHGYILRLTPMGEGNYKEDIFIPDDC